MKEEREQRRKGWEAKEGYEGGIGEGLRGKRNASGGKK